MNSAADYIRKMQEQMDQYHKACAQGLFGHNARRPLEAARTYAMAAEVMAAIEGNTIVVDSPSDMWRRMTGDMADAAFTMNSSAGPAPSRAGMITISQDSQLPVPEFPEGTSIPDVISQGVAFASLYGRDTIALSELMHRMTVALVTEEGRIADRQAEAIQAEYRTRMEAMADRHRTEVANLRAELDSATYAAYALAMFYGEDEEVGEHDHLVAITPRQDREIRKKIDTTTLVVEPGTRNTKMIGIR